MGGKTKFLIGGILFGLVMLFAFIGFRSFFGTTPQPPDSTGWQMAPAVSSYPANTPTIGANAGERIIKPQKELPPDETDNKPANLSTLDTPDNKPTIELVNEPTDPTNPDKPAKTDVASIDTQPNQPTPIPTKPTPSKPTIELPDETPPASQLSAAAAQPTATTGKLEIVSQAGESGQSIKANVYVQQLNGVSVDKANYSAKASFVLKPGTYKVTVRAEGRATVTRNIRIPANAVVNEIFPLPRQRLEQAEQTPPNPVEPPRYGPPSPTFNPQPAPFPPMSPAPQRPVVDRSDFGRLRVVALSADNGAPVPVDFTITRLDGVVMERTQHVNMTEFALPPQEVVVSFDYRGFKGYKSLTIQPGQTITHTFNIRGIH